MASVFLVESITVRVSVILDLVLLALSSSLKNVVVALLLELFSALRPL